MKEQRESTETKEAQQKGKVREERNEARKREEVEGDVGNNKTGKSERASQRSADWLYLTFSERRKAEKSKKNRKKMTKTVADRVTL